MLYDPSAELASNWLPELAGLPLHLMHAPFSMTEEEASMYGSLASRSYPEPLVPPASQIGALPGAKAGRVGSRKLGIGSSAQGRAK